MFAAVLSLLFCSELCMHFYSPSTVFMVLFVMLLPVTCMASELFLNENYLDADMVDKTSYLFPASSLLNLSPLWAVSDKR